MEIYKAAKKDFSELVKMGIEFWDKRTESEIEDEFKRIINSKKEACFIYKNQDNSFVGFMALSIRTDYVEGAKFEKKNKPVGYLEAVYIKKKYRNKGIASQLMIESAKWFKSKKVSEIGSDVEIHNKASQKFHEKIGFKKGETLIHYIKKA